MKLYFLEACQALTKSYVKNGKGEIEKTPYPFVWEFTSHEEQCTSLTGLEALLRTHAAAGHCLLKGQIQRPLVNESRAGSTNTNDLTEWMCLDFDGLTGATLHTIMTVLGFKDTSYIVQYSASADIYDNAVRAHVFVLLDKPTSAPLLKQWLIHKNHLIPELKAAMALTKTGNSLHWPLDISACQNDKLIYIAPPVLKNLPDPFKGKSRISLVKKKNDRFAIAGSFNTDANRKATNDRINELRQAAGIPTRQFKLRMQGSVEVLAKPDSAVITEMKQERGFVYFNLNGGDSWAYYHPENNPEFIFNFKGEPNYLTKELLPDYWQQLSQQSVKVSSTGLTYLAFCDRTSSAYWRGTYDGQADHLDLYQAKNETQLRHFAKQYGMPLGDFIPEWDLVFDPHDNVRVDFQAKRINTFSPSPYMKAQAVQRTQIPKTIFKVIHHALGGDADIVEHFINWLAFILQERDRTLTTWVLHGVPGTGKGLLASEILRPIFGQNHTAFRRMEELNEQYNHFMRNALLVFIDEVQTKALNNERGVMAKLRNFITEEFVPIRAMYSNGIEARNYTNWIFYSNMPDPVSIEKNDRRHNVAKYQKQRLQITDKEIAQIPKELQAFHDYLLFYPCDHAKARTVLDTEDRQTMISISESSVDTVSSAFLEGNFEFFMDQLPAGAVAITDAASQNRLENYKLALRALIERTKNNSCSISRDELRTLYEYVVGNMPNTPNKFTALLKHHRIHTSKVWVNNASVYGIKVQWADTKKFLAYAAQIAPRSMGSSTAQVVPITKKTRATP